MRLQVTRFNSPQENILYDEVLLALAERELGGDVLRLWESPQTFIVLGRTSRLEDDVEEKAVLEDGVPVLRRFSGGGTVVQGRGCFNYSLVLSKVRQPELNDLRRSYAFILEQVCQVMRRVGVEAVFHPISDLATTGEEKKFSGNAQHRGRNFILHHGTILYDFDLALFERYLRMPQDVPQYRAGRGHRAFVTNVKVSWAQLQETFCEVFPIAHTETTLSPHEQKLLEDFRCKYSDQMNVVVPGGISVVS